MRSRNSCRATVTMPCAALNPRTYGQSYNATRDENFTWRDYYREAPFVRVGTREVTEASSSEGSKPHCLRV